MHGRIPVDYPQSIADLFHGVKFEDHSFNDDSADSDVYTKLINQYHNTRANRAEHVKI